MFNVCLCDCLSQSKIRGHAAVRLLVYDCREGCRECVDDSYSLQSALRVLDEDEDELDRPSVPPRQ